MTRNTRPNGNETTLHLQLPGGRKITASRGEDRYWKITADDGQPLPSQPPHSQHLRDLRRWVRAQPSKRGRGRPKTKTVTIVPGSFAALLIAARERAGLPAAQAAEKAGVPLRTWEYWEYGERTCGDVAVLCRIARALGCESVVEIIPEGP